MKKRDGALMKKQIKEIYQMIRGNLRSLLLFEFFFRVIGTGGNQRLKVLSGQSRIQLSDTG
jgi:hypothetical protein